jgi:hypothetical protein
MSTLSEQFAREEEARKAKKKPKAKRDEHGRFVKEDADLTTPSF